MSPKSDSHSPAGGSSNGLKSIITSWIDLRGAGHWFPKCNSMRTRPGWVEPEIYFPIAHLAGECHNRAPAAYREQTVEIALGPKGAFENGNIGRLTRGVPTNRVVSAIPPSRGTPKPHKGAQDAPRNGTPPQSYRMADHPEVRRRHQPGRNRPPRGDHPRPGHSDHGHAPPGPGDPGTNPVYARCCPTPLCVGADAPFHKHYNGLPRPAFGVSKTPGLGSRRYEIRTSMFPGRSVPLQ
jgi:hypothetical protein